MKKIPYKRKPGDFEIRILRNGKVVMAAPDETLMEIAQVIAPNHCVTRHKMETKENVGNQTGQTE